MKIRNLGVQNYLTTLKKMQDFTAKRNTKTADELWIVEHNGVFTEGIKNSSSHLLDAKIEVVKTDRGGKITYHGIGQLIIYCLFDLKRLGFGVKKMVAIIEVSIVELLASYGIKSTLKTGKHGVYVDDAKIAALGLKVRNSKTYHGLSLNVDMDLSPFAKINPCGYEGLKVVQISDFVDNIKFQKVADELIKILIKNVTK